MLTVEEAIKMRGTEFIYVFEDGDVIGAYVKEFTPEVGLSCHALSDITNKGYTFPESAKDDNGEVCLMGYNIEKNSILEEILIVLEGIKNTGMHFQEIRSDFPINVVCPFV